MSDRKILVVDDEANVRQLVRSYLEQEGYQVLEAADGAAALTLARREHPDLIVLDLMLPEVDGIEVCRILRGESDVFILMLTARTEEADKLIGLGVGADDYLTKPFSPRELVARVKAILRRGEPSAAARTVLRAGDVEVDPERHEARVGDRPLELTSKEFEILAELAANPGIVYSREKLLENVWGYDYFGDARVVDVHVAKLRKKLEEDPARPQRLVTVRGVGYKLESGKGR
ncbi:MAG: DNA-binding response regulator [Gaiellales bacterium]|nr:MAG: DNA-binding response regulator [Gaiellales bacterium]